MGIYKKYNTNKDAEVKGVPVYFGDEVFYIKRAGGQNREYVKCLGEKSNLVKGRFLKPEEAERITAEVIAKTIIVKWENLHDKNGDLLPYSEENCVNLLCELPDFMEEILRVAGIRQTFQVDDLKN